MNVDNTFGSLFSGGGGLDLGLEQAGFKCVFQVENDKHCLTLLKRHWPDVPKNEIRPCVGLVGGDPCPIRSHLGKIQGSSSADLSGHFLAMVARCKPRWVLRENVCASDIVEFIIGLEVLRYHSVIIEASSKAFTGQSRNRQFVAAFDRRSTAEKFAMVVEQKSNQDLDTMCSQKQTPIRCLTSRGRSAVSVYGNFVYEGSGRGLRSLTHAERESLQGWPVGWTDGLPHSVRERITGNGVTAPVAEWLGKRIFEANR